MRALLSNVHFTLRLIRRSPAFYALVLVLLTAGIGATTAMLSVAESVLLKPLPYPAPEDLLDLSRVQLGASGQVSAANFLDWRAQGSAFEQMAAAVTGPRNFSSEGTLPVSVDVAEVTEDFFLLFRSKPLLGRLLGPDDDRPGAPLVAVISEQLWQSRFRADRNVVGRAITLNSRPYTIVGVAPRGFAFASSRDRHVALWKPYFGGRSAAQYADEIAQARGLNTLSVVGRKRHEVPFAEARTQMDVIARNLEVAYPGENAKTGISVRDLHDSLVGARGRQIWVLLAAVLLVFLVISANVATLLLARAQTRRGELATRAALGADASSLLVQVVTETIVLFGIGALLGSAAAAALVGELGSRLFGGTPVEAGVAVHMDLRALLAGVFLSLLLGLAAGIGPALVTGRVAPASVLQLASARAGTHKSQATLRSLLVVTQLAAAFALLTGSALAVKAVVRLLGTAPGFDRSDLATAAIDLPARRYETEDQIRAFYREAVRAIGDLPGVVSVAVTTSLPMSDATKGLSFTIEGRPPWPPGDAPGLGLNFISPGYFTTMRVPVLEGRDFRSEDSETGRRVMILSKAAADRFFPGESPIGRRMDWGEPSADGTPFTWREVVGVVGDVRQEGLATPPSVDGYTPFAQTPDTSMFVVARTKTPDAVLAALPRIVQTLDPELAVSGLRTMESRVAGTIGESHQLAVVLGAFALAALVLATLGLFGLVSYATAERTRELGIRLALGSSPAALVGLVVKGAMKLVLLGLCVGLLLSVWVGRELAAVLPGGAAFDPVAIATIPLVLGVAGIIACLLPALRAVRTPPAVALRYE